MADANVVEGELPVMQNCGSQVLKIWLYKGAIQGGVWVRDPSVPRVHFGYVRQPADPRSAQGVRKVECWAFEHFLGDHPSHGSAPYELAFEATTEEPDPSAWRDAYVDTWANGWPPLSVVTTKQIHHGDYVLWVRNAQGGIQAPPWRVSLPLLDVSEYWDREPPPINPGESHIFQASFALPPSAYAVRLTHT